MKVKPAPGLKVRDPKTTKPIPAEGCEIVMGTYWARRIKCGDVIVVEEKEATSEEDSKLNNQVGGAGQ